MAKVRDTDKGWKGLVRRVAIAAQGAHVEVGILGEDMTKPHRGLSASDEKRLIHARRLSKGGFKSSRLEVKRLNAKKRGTDSITIGEIGEVHEFGLGNNPVRSWLRGYVDNNRSQTEEKMRRVAKQVSLGKMTIEKGLSLIGMSVRGGIQKRIADGIAPPVTKATQARKGPGKTTALINSGQFRSSISYRVMPGKVKGA